MRYLLLGLISLYQLLLSPVLGGRCRFYPSCSQYAKGAVLKHGSLRGFALTVGRIARCNPWHSGGVDPIP
jgi:uncharacterized protein